MLVALRDMASNQTKATGNNYENMVWLQNYSTSHPISIIRYKESDMVLRIHAYALYLFTRHAYSQADGQHYLRKNSDEPPNIGAISTILKIMGNFTGSLAEAKIGSTYINAQDAVPLWICLIKMSHPQPSKKLQIYTTTAEDFSKGTLK